MANRLRGQFNHSVDAKGRLIIPNKLRMSLGEEFILTKGQDGCLYGFPTEEWHKFEDKLVEQPAITSSAIRKIREYFVGGSKDMEFDSQGRVNIPAELREYAHITKEVTIVGNIDKIEIWDAETWKVRSAAIEDEMEDILNSLEGLDIGF